MGMWNMQGLSERMTFLKFLVLGTESTKGAQICVKILSNGRHFHIRIKKTLARFLRKFHAQRFMQKCERVVNAPPHVLLRVHLFMTRVLPFMLKSS